MVTSVGGISLATASLLALLVAAFLSLYALYRLDDGDAPTGRLRRRFVLGVPWGSVLVVVLVGCVYLFVQGAWSSLTDPLVVPFRSWSYAYPLGMLTASFAHGSLGHVTGNLLSAAVFAPIVEYVWSHYPTARGSQSFGSWRTNPFARIGLFVVGVFLVGLLGSLFVPGPIIGFSGVVFAFAGFAIVTVPLVAIVAIVAVRVVRTAYLSIVEPVAVAQAQPRFVEPWFADVAIQGHAFGLLVGVLLGAALVTRRDSRPPLRYVWFATLAFAITETLYAFYWYLGADAYQLFRGAGMAIVFVLVALVVGTVAAADGVTIPRSELTRQHVAAGLLVAILAGTALAAVPYHLADVPEPETDAGIEVRDYTVFYDEDVPHGYVDAVSIPLLDDVVGDRARASGVIVVSDRREAWDEVVPAGKLALDGSVSVAVGGLGWRERIVANRTTWNAVDGESTYKVYLRRAGEPRRLAFTAEPVALGPQVAGLNLTIEPTRQGYALNASRNGSLVQQTAVPDANESARIRDVVFHRRGDDLFASHEETRIRLATFELSGREDD